MWSLCSFPEAAPKCSRDLALADVTTRVLTTGLAYYGLRDALLAARRKWLSSFESLRQDDAHRRHDGVAVRRAVCSAARTGASGALERARNGLRQKASVHGLVNECGKHSLPQGRKLLRNVREHSSVPQTFLDLSIRKKGNAWGDTWQHRLKRRCPHE